MANPVELAKSLIGKHRINRHEVEGKVNNIRLVDEILRKHGYRKVFCRYRHKSQRLGNQRTLRQS